MDAALDRRPDRRIVWALIAVMAAFSVPYAVKVLTPRHDGYTQSAIMRWTDQIQAMEGGENVHKTRNYPNPPIMAIILWPISEAATASPLAGALWWYYLKVAMVVWCYLALFRWLDTGPVPPPAWAKGVAVALSLRPILGDLSHGNVNIFILFLVVLCLDMYRRGHDVSAGVALALAVACKVTPALFVGYFLWKRSWKALAGVALGLVIFFLIAPAAVLGWDRNLEALVAWFEGMILPYVVGGQITSEYANQSLPGVMARLLTHAPSVSTYVNDVSTPLEYHNFFDWPIAYVKHLTKLAMLAFAVVVVWCCRASRPRVGAAWLAEFGLICVGMLAFSERTWKHHCVVFAVPFAALAWAAACGTPRLRRIAWGCMIGATLCITLTATGGRLDEVGKAAQIYGAYLPAYFLLGLGCVAVARAGAGVSTDRPHRLTAFADRPGELGVSR